MNLTLYNVHNEPVSMGQIFEILTALIQIIMAPILVYVIMTQSKQMGIFRFYLINLIVWNTMNEIILAIISPTILTPYLCIIVNGFFADFLSIDISYRMMESLYFVILNIILNILLTALNRFFTLLNITKMIDLFDKWKFLLGAFAIEQCLISLIIYTIDSLKAGTFSEENYNIIMKEMPFLDKELVMHRMICMCLFMKF